MKKIFIYANALVPMLIGGLMYYLISPDVIFVRCIDKITGLNLHISYESTFIEIIRNYIPDILWAYALVFSLLLVTGNKAEHIWKIYVTAGIFSIAIEVLQLTGYVKGTFDVIDIIVELIAEFVVVFIIKIIMRRKSYEEI